MSSDVAIALITTIGSIVAAFLVFLGVRLQVGRVRKRRAEAETDPDLEDEAIVKYENDPRQFVQDVLKDNADKAAEIRKQATEINDMRADITKMWTEVTALRTELDSQKREEVRFRDALGRWLIEIFAAWGKSPAMPWPKGSDAEILQSVLPNR